MFDRIEVETQLYNLFYCHFYYLFDTSTRCEVRRRVSVSLNWFYVTHFSKEMKKFKICLLLVGATYAQIGCSPLNVCPDMGDDFSCGILLTTYPDPEVKLGFKLLLIFIK